MTCSSVESNQTRNELLIKLLTVERLIYLGLTKLDCGIVVESVGNVDVKVICKVVELGKVRGADWEGVWVVGLLEEIVGVIIVMVDIELEIVLIVVLGPSESVDTKLLDLVELIVLVKTKLDGLLDVVELVKPTLDIVLILVELTETKLGVMLVVVGLDKELVKISLGKLELLMTELVESKLEDKVELGKAKLEKVLVLVELTEIKIGVLNTVEVVEVVLPIVMLDETDKVLALVELVRTKVGGVLALVELNETKLEDVLVLVELIETKLLLLLLLLLVL